MALGVGATLIVALTVAMAALSIAGSRSHVDQLAEVGADNLAETLQSNIARTLDEVDVVLRDVAAVPPGPAAERERETGRRLDEGLRLVPELAAIGMADAHGAITAIRGTSTPVPTQGLPAGASALTLAVVSSPGSGTRSLLLARPLGEGPAGGIVFAMLPLQTLQRVFDHVDVGAEGAITLRDGRRAVIMRKVGHGATSLAEAGTNVSPALSAALLAHPASGVYQATTALDGVERLTAYRQVGRYPLTVLVGLGVQELLAGWRQQSALVAGLALLMLGALLASGRIVSAAWRDARRSAAAFESQARRNRMLLRTASDGLHVLDRSGRLVKFSDSFAAALGRTREELDRAHVSLWDAGYDPRTMARWFESLQQGERQDFDAVHRRADGSLFSVEVSSSLVRIDGEELIYCSSRDVTQRKRLEAQLAESAAQIRSLYDGAPCAYHSLDEHGLYLYVNDTELAWLGCARSEVIGKCSPTDFLDEEGVEVFQRNFPRLMAGEAIEGIDMVLHGRDGRQRRVSVSATPMRDAEGRFVMSRSVMYDVTELHRTREHLQALMREQEAMLDNDLIGMVRLRDRRILWSNQAMCHLFGYELQELVGASTRILYPDDDSFESVGNESRTVLESGGRYRSERQLVRKDGESPWIEINGVMLSAERRESMWLFADITPSKRAYDHVQFLAFHDALTGLPNRTLLMDRLQQALNTALRRGCLVATCYIDLDDFKPLNDRLGHAVGDLLLKEVAARLASCTRAVDTVCRLGGDEFVVVLPELDDLNQCLDILGRIESAMHATVSLPGAVQATVSASIGVALFPRDAHTPDVLLACADAAMYEAKRRADGKVCFHRAPPGLRAGAMP
jgi:diguanylate cyclase (GGDEF)-like protein/PAS domain S-box-containing protein